jgi:hypothetical protein
LRAVEGWINTARSFIERPRQALVFELLLEARPDELVALTLAVALQDVTILANSALEASSSACDSIGVRHGHAARE